MNIAELLSKTVHKPARASTLEQVWRNIIAELEETFVPPLTLKERGQLKLFARRCPEGSRGARAHAGVSWRTGQKRVARRTSGQVLRTGTASPPPAANVTAYPDRGQ